DDADAVAAQHAGGEIDDDGPFAPRLRDILRLDDELARDFALGRLHAHIALDAPRVAPLLPQLRQFAHAPHVALAPRADAVGDPVLLFDDLAVELLEIARLLL